VHCEEFVERLADLLERDIDETTRAALESHALSCGDCGPMLADLRKLRIDASNLPMLAPTRDLWQGISQRIDAPVIPLHVGDGDRSRLITRWSRWAGTAAAAMLLVAITSTATYLVTVRQSSTDSATSLTKASSARLDSNRSSTDRTEPRPVAIAVVPNSGQRAEAAPGGATTPGGTQIVTVKNTGKKPSAEQVYSTEIARLRTIVNQRRSQLDPVTISVIERNLKVIDDAIAQCRLALAKDPASRFLMESLNSALETKVELLRTATMLPARS
jgi:hypothetical protein